MKKLRLNIYKSVVVVWGISWNLGKFCNVNGNGLKTLNEFSCLEEYEMH